MSAPYAIHWFRRDLRLVDNPALDHAIQKYQGRVLGLFSFDSGFLARPDFSHARFGFFLQTLSLLQRQMRDHGGDLVVIDELPVAAFERIVTTAAKQGAAPALVTFNRDYEPFARQRDLAVTQMLTKKLGVGVYTDRDHLLIEPEEFLQGLDRGPYQVFSPFQRRWMELFRTPEIQVRLRPTETVFKGKVFHLSWKDVLGKNVPPCALEVFENKNAQHVTIALPKAGVDAAQAKVKAFAPKIGAYAIDRDIPGTAGTSQLSIYFKNGSLTGGQVIRSLGLKPFGQKPVTSADKYLSELIWREFYYHILYWFPQAEKTAFNAKYADIRWKNNEKWFSAWKEGKTGYPIVDAGMRQLNETGWMHNRVRMIVASFLTKDLLIDWRWGEQYFMKNLLDGDLAPNNGGWQWAASTGCDPQPYFRIFNPYLQSKKFDADGHYIRRFVPELAKVDAKRIHEPDGVVLYPKPIVDHAVQRDLALALYTEGAKT